MSDAYRVRLRTVGDGPTALAAVIPRTGSMTLATTVALPVVRGPAALANALGAFGKTARAAINQSNELADLDTADLFTEVSRGVDKWLWMVEAHLERARSERR